MATISVKDAAGATVAGVELPLSPGRAAATASRPVVLSNEDNAAQGALTETAPATDTASSGLNGRLQRIAQRLTSMIAQLPASLGIKTAANSLSITHASDDAVLTATGAVGDAAWASGSGSMVALLKAIAGAAIDGVTASPVKLDQTSTNNQIALGNSPAANTAKIYTGTFIVAGSTLTRPANTTAYIANDSISDNATAGSVTAKSSNNLSDTNDHPIDLAEIALDSTDTGPGTAGIQIRLHLFNSDPTASSGVVGGDNAAWSNKKAGWIGSFSGTMRLFSDGSKGVLIPDEGTLRMIAPVSGAKNLYYQLQTLGAFTPSANSTTFIPTFKGFQARAA